MCQLFYYRLCELAMRLEKGVYVNVGGKRKGYRVRLRSYAVLNLRNHNM